MKIAWFSPLVPEHSDVANFTERLRADLGREFDVRYFTEKHGGFLEPANDSFFNAGLGPCPHDLLASLNEGDLPIYNLGNNPAFFARTWFLNQFKPGIVVLHDAKLHHFFEGIYRARLHDEQAYLKVLHEYYGPLGYDAGRAYCQSKVSIDFMARYFPMTAWAVRNALAVVVHTPHAQEVVRSVTNTPVWTIPLPYEPRASRGASGVSAGRSHAYSPDRRVKLIIFGYLNTNRRIIEFLHALATLPERDHFEVRIVGTVFHQIEVEAAVRILGLREQVTFYGYVSDEELDRLLEDSDLAINLRFPTMGEASGSQLRIWDHALPSLVTRTEGYASLPRDTVCFVRPDHERSDIQRHLRRFLRRPEYFREKGRRARQRLLAHHQPRQYVEALRPICEQVHALRSRLNRLTLADRVGRATSTWAAAVPSYERERFYAARIAETC